MITFKKDITVEIHSKPRNAAYYKGGILAIYFDDTTVKKRCTRGEAEKIVKKLGLEL